MVFDPYFERLEDHLPKGRGVSVYNCREDHWTCFTDRLKDTGISVQTLRTSEAISARPFPTFDLDATDLRITDSPITVQAWFRTTEARATRFGSTPPDEFAPVLKCTDRHCVFDTALNNAMICPVDTGWEQPIDISWPCQSGLRPLCEIVSVHPTGRSWTLP